MKARKKKLLKIELHAKSGEKPPEKILAVVDKIGDREGAEVFHFDLTHNENIIYDETLVSSSFELVKLKVLDVLQSTIDSFDPAETSIEVIVDSHSLLKKFSLCCPSCGRKLFESWGKVKGIATKCHRCGTVCIPSER